MATAAAATPHRRRGKGGTGPNSDLSRTLTDCTRRGDAAAAMAAFDAAVSGPDDLRLAAHQYNQLLHLLASADRASFPLHPAAPAARRVFAHMLEAGAPPSEATITSLARIVASDPEAEAADEAFQLVATMRDKYGVAPRLRSYSPVLAAFRRAGDAGKAYAVEAHMAASTVSPEEPELAALLEIEWLEAHKEYDAIVDGANIALYQQNFAEGGFSLVQLDAVVTELRDRYNGKWPLVILHTKRIAKLMENSSNRHLIETWRANGALYTSPSGSNDDWYWLYAAIGLNCLLVTNDEMRDHIFELLGSSSFFYKWKQRHRVKYTFSKGKAVLMMPPPYSSEIQESETASWHVPIEEKSGDERARTWLCIDRTGFTKEPPESPVANGIVQVLSPSEASDGAGQRQPEDQAAPVTGKRKDRD